MDPGTSKRFTVRARGPLACFTRPELKVERVSYEVMNPSAARGLLEAILWKPAMRWHVEEIAVLAPVAWTSFRRNEVTGVAVPGKRDFCADDERAQRNTVALRDVDYTVTARFRLVPEKAGPEDSVRKFEEMFERRLAKGQQFRPPFFGCREFAAAVEPAPEGLVPVGAGVMRPLGLMFYDFDYDAAGGVRPLFFDARLDGGVLKVPTWEEVLRQNEPGGQP
jgi:CRISPR-associated protein Cas5d